MSATNPLWESKVHLTGKKVLAMNNPTVQDIFQHFYPAYLEKYSPSWEQAKAAWNILNPVIYSNQKQLYDTLYHAASAAINELAADPNLRCLPFLLNTAICILQGTMRSTAWVSSMCFNASYGLSKV